MLAAVVAYLVLAASALEMDPARVARGAERAGRLFGDFLRPDFTSRWRDVSQGLVESLTMTVVATVVGVILSIPFVLAASSNIAPRPVYLFSRWLLTVLRSFPEVIIAIVFVVMIGFGPFAGLLTLIVGTIAFIGKLLAEAVEEIDPRQVEAVRATGAGWWQVVGYAILPQVMPRLAGLSVYRLDINFRESTILGIVGAGGIGGTLRTSVQRYDFDTAGGILILIIVVVLALEYLSGAVRARIQ